jgi:hypothetical protein
MGFTEGHLPYSHLGYERQAYFSNDDTRQTVERVGHHAQQTADRNTATLSGQIDRSQDFVSANDNRNAATLVGKIDRSQDFVAANDNRNADFLGADNRRNFDYTNANINRNTDHLGSGMNRNFDYSNANVNRNADQLGSGMNRNFDYSNGNVNRNSDQIMGDTRRNFDYSNANVNRNADELASDSRRNFDYSNGNVNRNIDYVTSGMARDFGYTNSNVNRNADNIGQAVERNGVSGVLATERNGASNGIITERTAAEIRGNIKDGYAGALHQFKDLSCAEERNTRELAVDGYKHAKSIKKSIHHAEHDRRNHHDNEGLYQRRQFDDLHYRAGEYSGRAMRELADLDKDGEKHTGKIRLDMCKLENTLMKQASDNVMAIQLDALKNKECLSKQLAECCCEIKEKVDNTACQTQALIQAGEAGRLRDALQEAQTKNLFLERCGGRSN